jgi:hypothetical protein
MRILTASRSKTTDPCIRHPHHDNLTVIPYVRCRLVFAELTARVIAEGQYDCVLVDLPGCLNGYRFAGTLTGFFPSVSSLVIRNAMGRFISAPLAPNDAAACAVAAVQHLSANRQAPEIEFVDDSQTINYQEYLDLAEPTLPDDYSVFVDGLAAYFSRPFRELDALLQELPEPNRYYLDYRAGQVAARIARHLQTGKHTLLVCEYRLWRQIVPHPTCFYPGPIWPQHWYSRTPTCSGRWAYSTIIPPL